MLIPVPNLACFEASVHLPLLSVDMGFSGKTASAGFAYLMSRNESCLSRNLTFSDCVHAVAEKVRQQGDLILLLEAPLSAAFDAKGNPQPRGRFESHPKPRWWSLGPGASMSLAAMHFLRRLVGVVCPESRIYLIEGYVVGTDSGKDSDVADALIRCAIGKQACSWQEPQGVQLISVVDWIQPGTHAELSPMVLIPTFG